MIEADVPRRLLDRILPKPVRAEAAGPCVTGGCCQRRLHRARLRSGSLILSLVGGCAVQGGRHAALLRRRRGIRSSATRRCRKRLTRRRRRESSAAGVCCRPTICAAREREFESALKLQPAFHPAQTGMGYLGLARNDANQAVASFDRALASDAAYVPALVGRGQALLELKRDGEALSSFEAALKADSSLTDLRGRIDVLRFRAVQDNLARAKAASDAGRWPEARAAYNQAIMASPDSAFLYRDLALVERKAGEQAQALEHFQKAVVARRGGCAVARADRRDPRGAGRRRRCAQRLPEGAGDRAARGADVAPRSAEGRPGARQAARRVSRDPVFAWRDARGRRGAPRRPPRADRWRRPPPRQAVVTDLRGHWAERWILAAVRAGVMDTQPNYTFQPSARVRRGDLAQTVSRVLASDCREQARGGQSVAVGARQGRRRRADALELSGRLAGRRGRRHVARSTRAPSSCFVR